MCEESSSASKHRILSVRNPKSGQSAQQQGQAHLAPRSFVAALDINLHNAEGVRNVLEVIDMGTACQGGGVHAQIVVERATSAAMNRRR